MGDEKIKNLVAKNIVWSPIFSAGVLIGHLFGKERFIKMGIIFCYKKCYRKINEH